ncbi:MAG: alpha/beta fold hydrolase [Proteobacteria bacterium]|nr:alpha/beta fold hydrolase [Pseudomonadota bacterium]
MDHTARLAEYPFTPRFFGIDGHRMAYLDEGGGLPVVMVHGNPSWSYLYRNLVLGLRKSHRCIVPDHVGCGFSAKPQNYPYDLATHIDNLERLLDHLEINRCVLVVHDWGGAIGMGWGGRHPERVAGLVVFNTAAFRSHRLPLRIGICRWPLLGPFLVRGLNGFARAATVMAVNQKMRPEIAQGFLAPYDSWQNRIALLRFVQDIPMGPDHPSWPALVAVEQGLDRLRDCPLLLCWGGRDFCFNDHFYEEWRRRFPQAQAHHFPEAGHYLLEEALPEIKPLIDSFLLGLGDNR